MHTPAYQGRSSVSNIGGAGSEKGPQQFGQKRDIFPETFADTIYTVVGLIKYKEGPMST